MEGESKGLGHLGKGELPVLPLESVGRIGGRLGVLLFLEGGVLGSSFKEVDEGSLQVPERLLERHTGDLFQPGERFLEIRQQSGKLIIVELLTTFFVGGRAGMQSPVVDEANTTERLCKNTLLFVCRGEPILVGSLRLPHALLALSLFLDMLFYRRQDLPVQGSIVLFGNLSYLFQQMSRKADSERFDTIFHVAILALIWLHVKWRGPLCPSHQKGTPLLSP